MKETKTMKNGWAYRSRHSSKTRLGNTVTKNIRALMSDAIGTRVKEFGDSFFESGVREVLRFPLFRLKVNNRQRGEYHLHFHRDHPAGTLIVEEVRWPRFQQRLWRRDIERHVRAPRRSTTE